MGLALNLLRRCLDIYVELINEIRIAGGKHRIPANRVPVYLAKNTVLPILALAPLFYYLTYLSSGYLLHISFLLCILPLIIPILTETLSYVKYVKNLKEDLIYFMLVDGVSPGDDLVKDLEEGSEEMCTQLTTLCNEYRRLKLFFKFYPGVKGIKEYVLRAPKPMRRVLLEYIMVRESANFSSWIYSKFQESLHEIRTSARRSLELKTVLTLLATVFSGLTPPLIALVMALGGGVPPHLYPALVLPGTFLVISENTTPKLLKISPGSRRNGVISTILTVVTLLLPIIGLGTYLPIMGVALCVFGSIATLRFIRTYSGVISLPSKLIGLADRVPYSRDPASLVEENLGSLPNSNTLASICYFMLIKSIRQGNVNTARIIAFKEVVEELFSLVKQSIAIRILVLITALILPFVLTHSISLAIMITPQISEVRAFCFASSLLYSIIATWIVFGGYDNSILVGSVILLLYALGAIP